ncbi:Bcr/CflA family efflux MFS transporter [Micromonospora endolithica]|uniref:Bcr/CflA family efflux MFS transporter n=2 Tax=Micromonospora endolithica TaxID=230091 RepID=A0A3A9YSE1_9ACTN|nr:Bcr/CflA family efflux MFS transporter [Micromonospora endolithica]TWJ23173.1 DHA1 family bicyclomycin/chloramphenicol resistance-like MFS transporter [Micromonospora endolithica]
MVALVLLAGVGPFATDAYIAALPELRRSLDTNATVAQLSLTAFIVGVAAGQLLLGPVSDVRGRRGIVVAGTLSFTLLSVVCALAPTGGILVAARLGQGIAAGAGVALCRAMVTDAWQGTQAAARFGTIASVTFLGPVVAPAVGGVILEHGSWRTVFGALAGLGLTMVVAAVVGLPETLPAHRRQAGGPRDAVARMGELLRDRTFRSHLAVLCLAIAGFFTYIGGSSFVFQTAFRVDEFRYTLIFATNAAGMAGAGLLFRVLVGRLGAARLRAAGVAVSTVATLALLVVALVDRRAEAPLVVPWALLGVVVTGMGLTLPATTALAQEAGRRFAGTAAALQGGLGFLAGAVVTPLTGVLGYTTLLPMVAAMAVFFVAASGGLVLSARRGGGVSQALHRASG